MKARLLPVQLSETNQRERGEFEQQLRLLEKMYGAVADFLPVQPLEALDTQGADACLFPQLIGSVFSHGAEFSLIDLPVLVLSSAFGTVEMWDWEIVAYLRENLGLNVLSPYNEEMARVIMRALAAKREMREGTRFLMFQDDPGEGMQASIFKRFYWWEKESTRRIENAFGIEIIYRSWKEVNLKAQAIPDEDAKKLWEERKVPTEGLDIGRILKAVKLYMAVKAAMDEIGGISGVGSNCLNESFHSQTTPCLAWNWMYEHDHIIWACEGDTLTLISKFILYSILRRPMMMTNIYPFLMGMAALKHEKIDTFPQVEDPDHHALGVHCGYFGLVPQSFCTHWTMRPRVFEIVNQDAVMLDCRMAEGPVTLA
ncbi:MAG: hypothetical protein PHG11_09290, partial [Eubacteriales bacterium]|nr:hypothetical protein [Eubacteriales bacterium]